MLLRGIVAASLFVLMASAQTGKAPASAAKSTGVTSEIMLENEVIRVDRIKCAAGCLEPVRSHPTSRVNVFLADAELELTEHGHVYLTNAVAGEVRYHAKGSAHGLRNVTNRPFEWLSITLKRDPRGLRPGVIPAGTTFQGMAVRRLLDNDAIRASFLVLDAGMRETPHSHPTDLLVVVLNPGEVETTIGGKTERRAVKPGDLMWFPRNVEHHASNVGAANLEDVGIHIK